MATPYNLLFEVSPLVGGTPTTLRITNIDADVDATGANAQVWLPCVTSLPTISGDFAADGLLKNITISHGEIKFFCNDDFSNHVWSSYLWSGALGRAWIAPRGSTWPQYTKIFEGQVSNLERDGNQVTVRLLGQMASITGNILTASYAGNGNAEGPAGLKGKLKPRCYGNPKSVEPVEVDAQYLVYQVHGYGPVSSITPYEYGSPLDPAKNKGNFASYAALIAAALVPGEWATCNAQGLFRFGGTPTPKISADVTMPTGTSLPAIARQILTDAGVIPTRIGDFSYFDGVTTDLYLTEQKPVDEVLRDLFAQADGYMLPDKDGKFQCGSYYGSPKTPVVLKSDQSAFPILRDWKEEPSLSSLYEVRYGNTRCWGVHSDSDASPLINELAANAAASSEDATAALTAAQIAQAQADAAIGRLTSISNDNVLDRSDKGITIRDYQAILAEQPGLDNQATALGITTQKTSYDGAITALTNYLNGLSPSYTDFTQDTPVDGPTFRQKFIDVYTARQVLINKGIEVGSTTASLTNPGITVSADASGVVASFANATGSMIVTRGKSTVASGVTYSVASSTGITATINASGVYNVTAMSADQGSATLRAVYDGQTLDRTFTAAKARQGLQGAQGPAGAGTPGADGKPALSATLSNESFEVWSFANGNVKDYNGATTTMSVFSGTTNVSTSFTYSVPTNAQNLVYTLSTAGVLTITGGFANAIDTASITIRATGTGTFAGSTLDKVFTLGKLKGGYELTTTLPTTNNFQGRIVYNTSDNKLYRYTGSAWTSATDASDIVGQLDGSRINPGTLDRSAFAADIEIPANVTSVPSSKLTNVIYNSTDKKLYRWSGSVYTAAIPVDDVTGQFPGTKIANGGIDTPQLAAGAVTTNILETGAVTAGKIAAGAVSADKLAVGLRNARTQSITFSVGPVGTINWTGGILFWIDDNNNLVTQSIAAGSASTTSGFVYISYAKQAYTAAAQSFTALSGNNTSFNNTSAHIPVAVYEGGYVVSTLLGATIIDGRSIATGTVTADQIGAQQIVASKLNITNTDNLSVNGSFETGTLDGWSRVMRGGASTITVGNDPGWPSKYGLRMYRGSGNSTELSIVNGVGSFDDTSMASGIPMEPGDELYWEAVCYTEATSGQQLAVDGNLRYSSSASTGLTAVGLEGCSWSGSYLYPTAGATFRKVSGYFRNNSGQRGKAYIRLWGPATQNTAGYYWNTKIRRRNSGQLIVDGSIVADDIGAGQVTAGKINVTELSAITSTVGLLRTSTSGQRTEIHNNGMTVFNGSGNVVVRVGVW